MAAFHFISYSSADAKAFALQLYDSLAAAGLRPWLDKKDLRPGRDWDLQLRDAIRECDSVVFVMSADSVEDRSECRQEWSLALTYKKPITPLLLRHGLAKPFRLAHRQYVDFSGNFDAAAAKLCEQLRWLASPSGISRRRRTGWPTPAGTCAGHATATGRASRTTSLRWKRRSRGKRRSWPTPPPPPPAWSSGSPAAWSGSGSRPGRPPAPPRPVHQPAAGRRPGLLPGPGRRDRADRQIDPRRGPAAGLARRPGRRRQDRPRLPAAQGPGGRPTPRRRRGAGRPRHRLPQRRRQPPGEFAQPVRRPVQAAAAGQPPGGSTPCTATPRPAPGPRCRPCWSSSPPAPRGRRSLCWTTSRTWWTRRPWARGTKRWTRRCGALLDAPHHAVTVVVTTRIAPRPLLLVQPGRQTRIDLDEGLPAPFAQNILREMDGDGKVGLRDAPDDLLEEARLRTRGYPRAWKRCSRSCPPTGAPRRGRCWTRRRACCRRT